MYTKLILLAAALAAAAWAIMRSGRLALNPQPEPPGVAASQRNAGFRLQVGGKE